jgi:oligopeptide transport system permease protein
MVKYTAKRALGLVIVLFSVVSITFFLVHIMPGGPFDRERKLPENIEKQLLAKYKLSGPILEQYLNYLGDLLHGDLRLSTKYRDRSVNEILADSLPVSGCPVDHEPDDPPPADTDADHSPDERRSQ